MNERETALFHDSLTRCAAEPGFLPRFGAFFLGAPDVAEMFLGRDAEKRLRVLKSSFHLIVAASDGDSEGRARLVRVAEGHRTRGVRIRPEHYDHWLESLMRPVQELDPKFSAAVEGAWRSRMRGGIDLMKSFCESSEDPVDPGTA